MCRILAIQTQAPFAPGPYLSQFAALAQRSSVYQGHGWGCAWRTPEGTWCKRHDLTPIWNAVLPELPATTGLLVHARSAFRDEGVVVENNMPFGDESHAFIFNGELHGVRIRSEGRIGAERLYHYMRRFDRGSLLGALEQAVPIIHRRSAHVRGLNAVLANHREVVFTTDFASEPEYFTLYERRQPGRHVVCSGPLDDEQDWQPIPPGTRRCLQ